MADSNTTTATIEPVLSSPATSTATDTTPKFGQGGPAPLANTTETFIREKFAALKAEKEASSPGPVRGADGKFAPKAVEQTNTAAAKQPDANPAEKPVAATQSDPEATAREERALTALRRAKVPKSILDGLDHDTRIQWGSDLAAEQSKTDKLLRSRNADSETRPDPQAGTPAIKVADPAQGTPQGAADLAMIQAKLSESMALDDDGRKLLEGYGAAIRAPLMQEIAATRESHAVLDSMVSTLLATQARTALVGEIPELADKAIFGRCKERMSRLLDSAGYDGIEDPMERITEAMRDAATVECRDAIKARTQAAVQDRNEKRAASQPEFGEKRSDASGVGGGDPITYAHGLLKTGRYTGQEVQRLVEQRFG